MTSVYPVSIQFMSASFGIGGSLRPWDGSFHRGLVLLETHPRHGGIDAHWAEHIKLQRPFEGGGPELVKM